MTRTPFSPVGRIFGEIARSGPEALLIDSGTPTQLENNLDIPVGFSSCDSLV